MAIYTIDPTDISRPLDTDEIQYAAGEFRALKSYVQTAIAGGSFGTSANWRDVPFNYILNPDYNLGLGTGTNPADMWKVGSSGNVVTQTRTAFTVGQQLVPDEPLNYMSYAVTADAGIASYAYAEQRIEGVKTFSNNYIAAGSNIACVSFWAKASTPGLKIMCQLTQKFGTGGTPSADTPSTSWAQFDLTTSWTRYVGNIVMPFLTGKTLGTNLDDYLSFRMWMSAGTNYGIETSNFPSQSGTFDVARVQVLQGANDALLRPRPLAQEQDLVARYIQRFGGAVSAEICSADAWSATSAVGLLTLPTPMRKAPVGSYAGTTATDYVLHGAADKAPSGTLLASAVSNKAVTLTWPSSAMTAGIPYIMQSKTANGILTLDASL